MTKKYSRIIVLRNKLTIKAWGFQGLIVEGGGQGRLPSIATNILLCICFIEIINCLNTINTKFYNKGVLYCNKRMNP